MWTGATVPPRSIALTWRRDDATASAWEQGPPSTSRPAADRGWWHRPTNQLAGGSTDLLLFAAHLSWVLQDHGTEKASLGLSEASVMTFLYINTNVSPRARRGKEKEKCVVVILVIHSYSYLTFLIQKMQETGDERAAVWRCSSVSPLVRRQTTPRRRAY